jgi:hypothetical protein
MKQKIGCHPQEDLANFGCTLNVKVGNFRVLLYFCYFLEPVVEIWQYFASFFFKSGELGPFFSRKILCVYLAATHSFNWHMPEKIAMVGRVSVFSKFLQLSPCKLWMITTPPT